MQTTTRHCPHWIGVSLLCVCILKAREELTIITSHYEDQYFVSYTLYNNLAKIINTPFSILLCQYVYAMFTACFVVIFFAFTYLWCFLCSKNADLVD